MAADLQAVVVLAQMIGVVDGPARQPEHLLFQFAQDREIVGHDRCLYTKHEPHGQRTAAFALAGASSTFLQAAGRSASVNAFGGFVGSVTFGCSTLSENQ